MDFGSFWSNQVRGLTVIGHRKSRGGGCRISYSNPLKVSSTRRSLEGKLGGITLGNRSNGKTEYETLQILAYYEFSEFVYSQSNVIRKLERGGEHGSG